MPDHRFTMTAQQARMIHQRVADHMAALKNWTVSAVEQGDLARSQNMVKELRAYEALFAAFNMDAKLQIAEVTGKEIEFEHVVSNVQEILSNGVKFR